MPVQREQLEFFLEEFVEDIDHQAERVMLSARIRLMKSMRPGVVNGQEVRRVLGAYFKEFWQKYANRMYETTA